MNEILRSHNQTPTTNHLVRPHVHNTSEPLIPEILSEFQIGPRFPQLLFQRESRRPLSASGTTQRPAAEPKTAKAPPRSHGRSKSTADTRTGRAAGEARRPPRKSHPQHRATNRLSALPKRDGAPTRSLAWPSLRARRPVQSSEAGSGPPRAFTRARPPSPSTARRSAGTPAAAPKPKHRRRKDQGAPSRREAGKKFPKTAQRRPLRRRRNEGPGDAPYFTFFPTPEVGVVIRGLSSV